jgi:hypothetical protein
VRMSRRAAMMAFAAAAANPIFAKATDNSKCRSEGHPCEGNQVCCEGLKCVSGGGNGAAKRCVKRTKPGPDPDPDPDDPSGVCGPCETDADCRGTLHCGAFNICDRLPRFCNDDISYFCRVGHVDCETQGNGGERWCIDIQKNGDPPRRIGRATRQTRNQCRR